MIQYLQVRVVYPGIAYTEQDFTSNPCWLQLRCGNCGKCASVKKPPDQLLSNFMLTSIYSVWTIHVYALEISDADTNYYPSDEQWNVCPSRFGKVLSDMKEQIKQDEKRMTNLQSRTRVFTLHANIIQKICHNIMMRNIYLLWDITKKWDSEKKIFFIHQIIMMLMKWKSQLLIRIKSQTT